MSVARARADMGVIMSLYSDHRSVDQLIGRHELVARGLTDILDPAGMPEEVLLSAWVLIKWCRVQATELARRELELAAEAKGRIEAAGSNV